MPFENQWNRRGIYERDRNKIKKEKGREHTKASAWACESANSRAAMGSRWRRRREWRKKGNEKRMKSINRRRQTGRMPRPARKKQKKERKIKKGREKERKDDRKEETKEERINEKSPKTRPGAWHSSAGEDAITGGASSPALITTTPHMIKLRQTRRWTGNGSGLGGTGNGRTG